MPNKAFATLLAALLLMLVLACAGPAAAAIPAGNTGWSWANPLPQGNALDTIAVSGGRVWAGGATGTLLRSDDGGASWIATRTGLLDDIRTIEAISPTSVVFAGRCALRRTDDGGATVKRLAWGSSDDTCPAQIRAVTFPSPLIGYLLLTNGDVYATGDGGDSWNKRGVAPGSTATGGTDAVRDIEFTGVSTGVLSVGSRVLQTVDAGANWTPVAAAVTGAGLFNFEFLNSNDGYAVGDHSDVLVTTDGGASWNVVAGDFVTRTASLTSLSCADVSTCVATLATSPASTSVLRTVDGGAHWTPISTGASAVNAAGFAGGSRVVAAGAMGAIQLSSDAGATWFRVNSVAEGKFTGLRSDSARSALVFGNEGAIARSTDGGATWASLEEVRGAEILDATAVGGKRIYSVDTDGYVARTTDGGRSWITFNAGPLGVNPQALFAWGSSRLLIVGSKGVRISTKGGPKSKAVAGPISKLTLRAIDGAGANVYAYGSSAIALTKDKGRTWKKLSRPRGSGKIVRLDMIDAKYGFLLDAKAELFATRTGGKAWSRVETTGANTAVSMAFGDRKHGYLTDNSGRVLATADGGLTWSRQYPFFDSTSNSNSLIAATARLTAISLVRGTNRIFSSTTGGRIGSASLLTINPSAKSVSRGSVVRVTGKLSPATGAERVAVLARVVNAKGGTRWVSQERTVSATGTFTTSWRISASTEFIARWSGDAAHDGDAAPLKIVKLRK